MHPTHFAEVLQALPSMSLPQLERLTREADSQARRREAQAEIEKRAADRPSCPYCSATTVIRWGTSGSGLQRWRCRGCQRTFNSAHGSGLARSKRRDLFLAFIKNMMAADPWS